MDLSWVSIENQRIPVGQGYGLVKKASEWGNGGYLHVFQDESDTSSQPAGGLLVGLLAGPDKGDQQGGSS